MQHRVARKLDRTTPLLRKRVQVFFRHLPKALAGHEEEIHQMRVAGRRLRLALPVLAQGPEGKRVPRALGVLKRLTQAAGTSRDLDVSFALFEERLKATGSRTPALTMLRRRLRAAQKRSRTRMAEALLDIEIARLRKDVRRVLRHKGVDLFTTFFRLKQRREEEGAGILSALQELGDRFDVDALHGLRKRTRRLRYLAELQAEVRGRALDAPKVLKEMQENLGLIRDTHILATWLRRQAAESERRGQSDLAHEARRQEVALLEAGASFHRALLARNPVALVKQTLSAMGQSRPAA